MSPRRVLVAALLVGLAPAVSACSGGQGRPSAVAGKAPSAAATADGGTTPPPAPIVCPTALPAERDLPDPEAFESKKIVKICLFGASSEETRAAAERALRLREGADLTGERVRSDLSALLALGLFDNAEAWGKRAHGGVVVHYNVHERPRVAELVVEGAKVLREDALARMLPAARESPFDPGRLHLLTESVRDEYRSRGYAACEVTFTTERVDDAHVRIKVKVSEGLLQHVALAFKGNAKISAADLRKVSSLEEGEPLVQDRIERATLMLSALYYDRGMLEVRINVEQGAPRAASTPITFTIDEGNVFKLAALQVTKLGAPFEKELLSKVLKARPTQLFSRSAIKDDMDRVAAFFANKNQRVRITPLTEVDPKTKTVRVTLEVEPESASAVE